MKSDGFVEYMSRTFAPECPTGHRSDTYAPLMSQPSYQTRDGILYEYVDVFSKFTDASGEWLYEHAPSEHLAFSAFLRYWDADHPTLRVAKKGYDFCHL